VQFVQREYAEDLTAEEIETAGKLVAAAWLVVARGNARSWGLARAAASVLEPVGIEDRRARIVDAVLTFVAPPELTPWWQRSVASLRSRLLVIDPRFASLSESQVEEVLASITPTKRGHGAVSIVRAAANLAVMAKVEAHPAGRAADLPTKRFRKAYKVAFGIDATEAFAGGGTTRAGSPRTKAAARRAAKPTSE
jgi:hypothetical protein